MREFYELLNYILMNKSLLILIDILTIVLRNICFCLQLIILNTFQNDQYFRTLLTIYSNTIVNETCKRIAGGSATSSYSFNE